MLPSTLTLIIWIMAILGSQIFRIRSAARPRSRAPRPAAPSRSPPRPSSCCVLLIASIISLITYITYHHEIDGAVIRLRDAYYHNDCGTLAHSNPHCAELVNPVTAPRPQALANPSRLLLQSILIGHDKHWAVSSFDEQVSLQAVDGDWLYGVPKRVFKHPITTGSNRGPSLDLLDSVPKSISDWYNELEERRQWLFVFTENDEAKDGRRERALQELPELSHCFATYRLWRSTKCSRFLGNWQSFVVNDAVTWRRQLTSDLESITKAARTTLTFSIDVALPQLEAYRLELIRQLRRDAEQLGSAGLSSIPTSAMKKNVQSHRTRYIVSVLTTTYYQTLATMLTTTIEHANNQTLWINSLPAVPTSSPFVHNVTPAQIWSDLKSALDTNFALIDSLGRSNAPARKIWDTLTMRFLNDFWDGSPTVPRKAHWLDRDALGCPVWQAWYRDRYNISSHWGHALKSERLVAHPAQVDALWDDMGIHVQGR